MKKIKNNEQNVRGGEKSRQKNTERTARARREYIAMREHFDRMSIDQMVRNITR